MANEIKIVSGESAHRWHIDSNGMITDHGEGRCAIWFDDSEALNEDQASAIRGLIVSLREGGDLDDLPEQGIQYPTFDVALKNYGHAETFLRCWTDDCDEELGTLAWLGVSTEVEWSDPPPPVEPAYEWVAGEPVIPGQQPAAGEEEEPQADEHGEWVEEVVVTEPSDIPGQVTCMNGDEGDTVFEWQGIVNELIETLGDEADCDLIEVDGDFGPVTEEATRVVQSILGVADTGACDQETWFAVLSL